MTTMYDFSLTIGKNTFLLTGQEDPDLWHEIASDLIETELNDCDGFRGLPTLPEVEDIVGPVTMTAHVVRDFDYEPLPWWAEYEPEEEVIL